MEKGFATCRTRRIRSSQARRLAIDWLSDDLAKEKHNNRRRAKAPGKRKTATVLLDHSRGDRILRLVDHIDRSNSHDQDGFGDMLQLDSYDGSLAPPNQGFSGSPLDMSDQFYSMHDGSPLKFADMSLGGNSWRLDNQSTGWMCLIEEADESPDLTRDEKNNENELTCSETPQSGDDQQADQFDVDAFLKSMSCNTATGSSKSKKHKSSDPFPGLHVNAKSPLHVASSRGHLDIATLLIQNGAHVDAKDQHSRTALHHAALNNHEALVELLLINGANLEALDNDGCTAVYYGAERGYGGVVKTLIRYGATVNGYMF